ncbi:MAG TPA: ParA family protein [Chloroflexia bacterium]|nr:ParA family protein [Chloroflexia bacterium]
MKTIAIGMQKGGTGKTTSTICLAAGLVLQEKKVLVIDLDPQANLSVAAGVDPLEARTIYDCLKDTKVKASELLQESPYGFDIIPANLALSAAEVQLVGAVNRDRKLANKLKELEREGYTYDYVLIDCAPSLGILTLMALTAANWVMIPLQCQQFAAFGLNDFLDTVNLVRTELNPDLKLLGILLTMYDSRTRMSKAIAQEIREAMGDQVLKTLIKYSTTLAEVPTRGPVQAYDPRHEVAQAYNDLAKEIITHDQAATRQ